MRNDVWCAVFMIVMLCIALVRCDNSGGYAAKYTDAGIYYD